LEHIIFVLNVKRYWLWLLKGGEVIGKIYDPFLTFCQVFGCASGTGQSLSWVLSIAPLSHNSPLSTTNPLCW